MRGYHIRISVQQKPNSTSADTFTPTSTSLFQHLPSHPPKSTARRNATFNPKNKDYRFGPIRIDWIDFEEERKKKKKDGASATTTAGTTTMNKAGKEREAHGRGQTSATFVPDSRGSTNLPEGVVRIFRNPAGAEDPLSTNIQVNTDENTLAVLAVPSWMTPSDFLAFVAPAAEGIVHLRMIRDSAPNRSMVVIQLRTLEDSGDFVEAYNGKPFNSMEPEICHVVKVLSVSVDAEDATSLSIARLGSAQGTMYELPTCPVCLERMDSAVTGLVTVPCSHTFHCMCLSKWGDSRCPVCRYSQTLLSSHPTSANAARSSVSVPFTNPSSTPSLSTCADCSSTANLWICLVCGNIGCGRYGRAHAQAHYQNTTHLYALELETQRVWDYAGDGYVHRLIQNKADGKLVELPSAATSTSGNGGAGREGGLGPGPSDTLTAEKIEAIGIEYSYLLTSQLDSQRVYYEEQTKELEDKVDELRGLVEKLAGEVEQGRKAAAEEQERKRSEEANRMNEMERDKVKAEKKAERLAELARRMEKELKEERMVGEGLMENLRRMKEKLEQAEKDKTDSTNKIAELEDQVRDVMFFLEARNKIETGEGDVSEAAGGSLEIHSKTNVKKKKGKKG